MHAWWGELAALTEAVGRAAAPAQAGHTAAASQSINATGPQPTVITNWTAAIARNSVTTTPAAAGTNTW